jgi:hypothetical protein
MHGSGLSQHTESTAHKPSAVLQAVFYVMVFVSQRTCSTFIFLKRQKKIKELQPRHKQKHTPQKTA